MIYYSALLTFCPAISIAYFLWDLYLHRRMNRDVAVASLANAKVGAFEYGIPIVTSVNEKG